MGAAAKHALERSRQRQRRWRFRVGVGLAIAAMLVLLGVLAGCAVIVHTEDHVRIEVDRSAIHVAPKVEVRNDRRYEQAI